jgi:hypothetical protein
LLGEQQDSIWVELLGLRTIALSSGSVYSWLAVRFVYEAVDAEELVLVLTVAGHEVPLDVSVEESEQGG